LVPEFAELQAKLLKENRVTVLIFGSGEQQALLFNVSKDFLLSQACASRLRTRATGFVTLLAAAPSACPEPKQSIERREKSCQ
jgi:hypothetical protein